jgi:GT2 family glycosyltransferase
LQTLIWTALVQLPPPAISVIIPTFNRSRELANCLAAFERSNYPDDQFEIIVVDDGSVVSPESTVALFNKRLDVKLIRQANTGPSAARNAGAKSASGHILAFTDDDCAPAADWLQQIAFRFAAERDCIIVGGRTLNALSTNIFSAISQHIVDIGYAYHNQNPNQARFFTANNLAVRADDFYRVGGFDVSFANTASEDRELCGRWLHHGYRMIYAPEAMVYHAHSLTWRTFCQQHFNYGRGALLLQQVRKREGWQLFRPDGCYYARLLSSSMYAGSIPKVVSVAALLIASQTATAAGMAVQWVKKERTS